MREAFGNLWTLRADARCITTNGYVNRAGEAVMGRGCAAQAKILYPWMPKRLGELIKAQGNRVYLLGTDRGVWLLSFPVKHRWDQPADLGLIAESCRQLMDVLAGPAETVLLPRPGCGNGRLRWEDVRPVIEPLLDDRIVVVTRPEEAD